MFQVGSEVTWESQSQGVRELKKGTVLAFVPPGMNIGNVYPEIGNVKRSQRKFSEDYSQNARYLVSVPRGGKSQISDIYSPSAKVVERYMSSREEV